MYLDGVGIRKQGLDVGKLDACIKVWQPTDEVCTNEVQCQTGLDVGQWNASIPIWQLMPAVCRRKTGLDVSCPQFAQTKCSVKQG